MQTEIIYRAAAPADAFALAELSILAGDGMFEFLLEEFAPKDMLAGLMARSMREDAGGSSWAHCYVAEEKGTGVVGMINAFPAEWLRQQERDMLPQDRVQVLDPIDQAQDWESFLVSAVAVRASHRRRGIGKQLLAWAVERAKLSGFHRISANVWQDNLPACGLFQGAGFLVKEQVVMPKHPALQHGDSLVMGRDAS